MIPLLLNMQLVEGAFDLGDSLLLVCFEFLEDLLYFLELVLSAVLPQMLNDCDTMRG